MNKVKCILFDIDGTLFEREWELWTGGDSTLWQNWCEEIQKINTRNGFDTIFGIATFKPHADSISDRVLGIKSIEHDNMGLSAYIHPDFIFFTGTKSKVENALDKALRKLQKTYPNVEKSDISIIDDSYKHVIEESYQAGYNSIHAIGFSSIGQNSSEKKQRVKAFLLNARDSITSSTLIPPTKKTPKI